MTTYETQCTRASALDVLTGAVLFLCTVSFVLFQNLHVTVLWDLSYVLENATRISLGQLPYRDFPFPYAPLTFFVQAAIIKLFGRAVIWHYVYAAVASGLATLLTWRILLILLRRSALPARLLSFLLALPLVFLGTSSIFPHPFYDSDCTLAILLATWLMLRIEAASFPSLRSFGIGILLSVPLFIKQNTGLAFLLSAIACLVWYALRARSRGVLLVLSGTATGLVVALALIHKTVGLANYVHWTFGFAASRRLPGMATMVGVYGDPSLRWIYITCFIGVGLFLLPTKTAGSWHMVRYWIASALLLSPFLWAVVELVITDNISDRVEALLRVWPALILSSIFLGLRHLIRPEHLSQLVPFILLCTIHGAFLSQQLWGSTYALWPLLMLLLATVVTALASFRELGQVTPPLTAFAVLASAALLITGSHYALSHERLDYVDLSGDKLMTSKLPALRGLAMRGDWLQDFEELVNYANCEIPRSDAILMIPGEDLFYYTTGRTPQFPVLMMDNTVNPYSAAEISELTRQRNVKWIVVKRNLQLQEEPLSFRRQLMELLLHDFARVESLNNYDIYRRS